MTHLSDILNTRDLEHMVKEGYIRRQVHPTLPYQILNYAEKAQFEGAWNRETMMCRGLIATHDGMVLARPFRKFFNLGQSESPNTPDIPWHESYQVFDKADGSLGILYPSADGYQIATRGSFTSEQAIHATNVLWKNYNWEHGHPDWTPLFEIVYPDNRIVLDYDGMDDLIMLGAVHIDTGVSLSPDGARALFNWPGPVVESYAPSSVDALVAEDRPNKEGYVLWFPAADFRVKVKHETYLQLHRVITNANTKNVWKALLEGSMDEIYALPDEFRSGIDAYVKHLWERYKQMDLEVWNIHAALNRQGLAPGRETAAWVIENSPSAELRAAVFAIINRKPYAPIIWRALKPEQAEGLWGLDLPIE